MPGLAELGIPTPSFLIRKGEVWQFCPCHPAQPMVYTGTWTWSDFSRAAPDGDGQRLMREMICGIERTPEVLEEGWGDGTAFYVFRCPDCGTRKAYWDMA